MRKSKLVLITIPLFLFSNIFAQDPPVEWGEIPMADLQMTSFPADTNASALILCDYGDAKFDDDLNIQLKTLIRVKILSAKGYELGTKSITVYTHEDVERIEDIEGVTYSLDENGDIAEAELDEDDIFEEKIDEDYTRYKFTMPALKPGCVFEIRYTIKSKYLSMMKDWTFQQSEPVRWSEYRITSPVNIAYSGVRRGYEPWAINEINEINQVFSGTASSRLGKSIVACNQFRWAVKDAPAVRKEPFITTTSDYVNKVEVQLSGYVFVGVPRKQVLENWPIFIEELLDYEKFGDRIDVSGDVRRLAEKITAGLTSPEEKMKAIYNWVSTSIVSTGNRVYADQSPDDVIEYKKGSNADATFLLLSLLKSAGITCHPVIASTRGNGRIQELYPIESQFNYVLARVNIGTKTYYLDATDPYRPYDLLPFKILNVKGLVMKEGNPEWVIFNSPKRNNNGSLIIADINNDGSLTASFEDLYSDYKALGIRSDLQNKKDDEIAKELFDLDASGFSLDSALITNKDSLDEPLKIKAWVSSDNYAQKSGDMIYINPYMIHRLNENPFKTAVRKYPVDYGHKSISTTVMNITIPDNYQVKEMLPDRAFSIGNSISFSRRSEIKENFLQILNRLEIKSAEIKPALYEQLKNFYAQVVAINSEQLVLSLKEETPGNDLNITPEVPAATGKDK